MSSILVPVDFSIPSHNAYRYALHLAASMELNVVLAHYYSGAIDPRAPFIIAGDGSIAGSYETRLRQFAYPSGDGVDYPLVEPPAGVSLSYETEVRLTPSAAIMARAGEPDIAMIVMATRSSRTFLGPWLGSTSITVSEACERPVFLIPPGATYTPFDRIVVANNHATAAPFPLKQIEGLANFSGGKVHFVHVEEPRHRNAFRFIPWRLMETLVDEAAADAYPFEVVTVPDRDITHGLLEYATEIDADLVVIVNRLRSRWQALIRASLAQDVALRADRPLLVLHTEEHLPFQQAGAIYRENASS